ncbi:rod-binding protein [Geomonas subterranea]|uniref:Rod-binding protein n=1 Tax=Geomonas subterranea TaxID=2847989 RepID=A0ABX8LJ07_9BACT|nr:MULTISPECIES: rod-binding protein [Geomonas]QXE90339.1 rod-binding protein [Geomonas subterranea]QXM07536.1 rod-binding protein [Geomonas subterranea]
MDVKPIPDNALPVTDLKVQKRSQEQNPEQIKKVAREFESMFVAMMLKSMRDTVGKDTLTGGGKGEETFRSLLDQEYANAAVQGGGIGLAQTIERELSRAYGTPAPAKGVRDAD